MGGNSWYLVNATDGNVRRSGMAFYSNDDNAASHQAPDLYVEIQADGNANWEGNLQEGDYTGDYLRTCIVNGGNGLPVGKTAGVARSNGRAWNIYKADGSVVWSQNGWSYAKIYACA